MKTKIGIIIFVLVAAGLFIALLATKKQTEELRRKEAAILDFSNQLTTANSSLNDLRQVNLILTNDVAASRQALEETSNKMAETASSLVNTRASLENAQGQITNLNTRINDLETENQALDARANSLSNSIVVLNLQIAETKHKLAVAETNNTFLALELQKQVAQRAELERKYNDLSAVRDQLNKLRDDALIARRAQWIKDGTTPSNQPKGAQLLMKHSNSQTAAAAPENRSPQYDLNVEVGSDGSVHVLPATNSTAH